MKLRSNSAERRAKLPVSQRAHQPRSRRRAVTPLQDSHATAVATGLEPKQSAGFFVRTVRAADLAQVIALDQQVTGLAKPDYWRSLFQRYDRQRDGQQFFLVAADEVAGTFCGFIVGEIRAWEFGSAPCGWVHTITVRPETRLRGLGQTLFDAICADFKRLGVARTRTMVARDDRPLLMFFRAVGMMAGPYIELEKDLD